MVKYQEEYRIAYDELTDTLYLSEGQPQIPTDSYLDEDYILVRKVNDTVTGITIDGFKDRHNDESWSDDIILKYLPNFSLSSLFKLFKYSISNNGMPKNTRDFSNMAK